jgi:uncharacterized membrane-anchored protein YjiN (DUF445 family)
MKKLLQILFLVQFTFLSCNSRTEKKTELKKPTITENLSSVNQIKVSQTEKEKEAKIDTAKIKKYAQQILENKIYPSDDDETFGCMNQLFTENQKDLNLYFNVFRVIVKKSDGALSEVVGQYILNFLKSNPDFFIKQYSEFDSEEKNRFTGFMAYEFYFSETDYKAEIDEFFTKVSNGIKSESETRILTEIKESVKKETESIINESPD